MTLPPRVSEAAACAALQEVANVVGEERVFHKAEDLALCDYLSQPEPRAR